MIEVPSEPLTASLCTLHSMTEHSHCNRHMLLLHSLDLKPEEKIVYDMEYIANMSVRMDLRCMVRTLRLVFTHEGAR